MITFSKLWQNRGNEIKPWGLQRRVLGLPYFYQSFIFVHFLSKFLIHLLQLLITTVPKHSCWVLNFEIWALILQLDLGNQTSVLCCHQPCQQIRLQYQIGR